MNTLAVYHSLQAGIELNFPEDNYIDYLRHERSQFDRPELKAYWKEKLSKAHFVNTGLALSRAQIEDRAAQGHLLSSKALVSDEQWAEIRTWCRKNRITPPIFFKALYGVLLKQFSDPDFDMCISEIQNLRSAGFSSTVPNSFAIVPFVFAKDERQG